MALLVIGVVIVYGFMKHGTHFLGLFVPSGVPGWLLPLLVVIEVISFLSRPISLSVRLFANMLAGHIALKIFAGFVGILLGTGAVGHHRSAAAGPHRRAHRARGAGRRAAGLCLRDVDLDLPQRRPPPRPLIGRGRARLPFPSQRCS